MVSHTATGENYVALGPARRYALTALDEARLEHRLRRAAYEMGAELHVGRVEGGEWLASFRKYSVPKELAPEGAILMSAQSPDRGRALVSLDSAWRSTRL